MQSKGFIRVITVLLVLICAFYLSFSFVTKHYEDKAHEFAQTMSKTDDQSNDKYKKFYREYIDSIANEKVYLNYYTYKKAQEMEVGLGLDLKGGMNVTLQVSVPDILTSLAGESNANSPEFKKAIAETDSLLQKGKAGNDVVEKFFEIYNDDDNLKVAFRGIEEIKKNDNLSNQKVKDIIKNEVNVQIKNSYNVLRSRIDRFGVVAPNIQELDRQGQILLELPGIKDPERVTKLLKGTANLEFYETYDFNQLTDDIESLAKALRERSINEIKAIEDSKDSKDPKKDSTAIEARAFNLYKVLGPIHYPVIATVAGKDTADVNNALFGDLAKRHLPANLKLCWTVKPEKSQDGKEYYQLLALKTTNGKCALTGDVVEDATDDFDQHHRPVVSMVMNDEGARKWARITANNIGKPIAIVLDNQVYSYPNVNQAIEGGRSEISGNFTIEETKDLANILKSGKMDARIYEVSNSVIGPSLGKEAIQSGFISFIVALVLLMIFMCLVYGIKPGMVANMCLIFNLFFTMGILASIQAVLTLSGIAGIVLSLGMAVDANVLIYERTKEELRAGKNLKAAIGDGYRNAFSAIFDSNLTSVITGIILLIYGTGPIKGFATTLIIGIACSFFTAVFLSRVVIEGFINRGGWKNVTFSSSITKNLWANSHINFIGKRKIGFTIVFAVIAIFIASFAFRGLSKGIDFSGGRNYIVKFDHDVKTSDIQSKLAPLFKDASVSVITIDNDQKIRISTNYKINDSDEKGTIDKEIMDILYKGLKDDLGKMTREEFDVSTEEIGVISVQKVGPSIAQDITRGALWAVGLSLLAMALYILLRFRNISFSIGALAAVAFTAFVIVGLYSLLYGILPFAMEIDQTFIAAILTVIGYQVNDTVVVFDRVRETHGLYPKQDWMTTFNTSINNTLTRTIMTSVTTLLVLLCIFILGGEAIRSFTFAMIIGVIVGTMCSIFVAAPTAYGIQMFFQKRREKKLSK